MQKNMKKKTAAIVQTFKKTLAQLEEANPAPKATPTEPKGEPAVEPTLFGWAMHVAYAITCQDFAMSCALPEHA
jgi:hypothetical protein